MQNYFSNNFKRLREEEGLTQKQLGKMLGMTQRRISYLENGKVEPDIDALIIIAAHFDVTIDSLLKNDD